MNRLTIIMAGISLVLVIVLGLWLALAFPTFKTVPRLIKELHDNDPAIRAKAAEELKPLGSEAKEAVPDLIEALGDENSSVRALSAVALAYIDQSPEVVRAILPLLQDREPTVRINAIYALAAIGPRPEIIDALAAAMEDKDISASRTAINSLADFGPDASPAIPAMLALLKNVQPENRRLLLGALAGTGPHPEVIDALIAELSDDDFSIRISMVSKLAEFGSASQRAVPGMLTLLDESFDDLLKSVVIVSLGKIGLAPGVEDVIIKAIQDESMYIYNAGLQAAVELGPEPGLINATISAVSSDDISKQDAAIYTLGKFGTKAREAIPILKEQYSIGPEEIRAVVVSVYSEVAADDNPLPFLIEAMDDESVHVRSRAAKSIGDLGPAAIDATPVLLDALADKPWVAVRAACALDKISADNHAKTIPVLINLLDETTNDTAALAALEIARIGPEASDAVPKLKAIVAEAPLVNPGGHWETLPGGLMVETTNLKWTICLASGYALAAIEPGNKDGLYLLVQALGDEYTPVRDRAFDALTELGPKAVDAKPALEAFMASTEDKMLRKKLNDLIQGMDATLSSPPIP